VKALRSIGFAGASRFAGEIVASWLLAHCGLPQLRVVLLRLFGAKVGANVIIHSVRFINLYRGSFRNLRVEDDCFIGHECLIDLAGEVTFGKQVTLAQRVCVMTHLNVGYSDHPLQGRFPAKVSAVEVGDGSFLGLGSMMLAGVRVGRGCFVAAGAVVASDVPDGSLVGGVPARVLRE